jgi:hypothetical protein
MKAKWLLMENDFLHLKRKDAICCLQCFCRVISNLFICTMFVSIFLFSGLYETTYTFYLPEDCYNP